MSMKKLQSPSGPVPEAYKQPELQQPVQQPLQQQANIESVKLEEEVVPPKSLYNYNLKSIGSFKQIRRKYKMSNQHQVFVKDLGVILSEYAPASHQFDNELLLHILNIAESFFIYGNKTERNELKEKAVRALMLPYFRDDDDILNMMISSVWVKVKKTNLLKRLAKRLSNAFFLK